MCEHYHLERAFSYQSERHSWIPGTEVKDLLLFILFRWLTYDASAEDQAKIRKALKFLRVDSADIPSSAQHQPAAPQSSSVVPSQRKRKATFDEAAAPTSPPSSSQPATSQQHSAPHRATIIPAASQQAEDEEENASAPEEEEPVDELYATLNTNVVGIQYYRVSYFF